MNKGNKETVSTRLVSCAFMILALAVFKPFGLEVWHWQTYIHLSCIFALGLSCCFLTEIILRYVVRMPRSLNRGVSYIIRRNLWFQCVNTPLVSLLICLYRHFAMSGMAEGNRLSWGNYVETLVIIAFLSFAIGLYWRFLFRNRYLAAELEETRLLNEHLKKLQSSSLDTQTMAEGGTSQNTRITLEGSTNGHVTLDISDLLYIEAVGNYVKVFALQATRDLVVNKQKTQEVHTYLLRATMKQMEDTLRDYPTIVRCHRAFLVNLGQVEQISSNSHAMQLMMRHSHDAIPVSRSNVGKLKELLGQHSS